MLKIVGIVLLVALCIPFVLLALLLLAMTPRTGVHVRAVNGSATLMIFYGRLHRVFRLPRTSTAQRKKKAASMQPGAADPVRRQSRPRLSGLDAGEAVRDALGLLEQMKEQLRIDTLRADVTIATGDAAYTGLLLGTISAIWGMIYAFLEQTFHIKDFHAAIDGDFQGAQTRYELEVSCSVRPIAVLWLCLRNWKMFSKYLRVFKFNQTEAHTT